MTETNFWVVSCNAQEGAYNVYRTKARAEEAVERMRARFGEAADHFDPHIVECVKEGQAFGGDLNVEEKRKQWQDMILD